MVKPKHIAAIALLPLIFLSASSFAAEQLLSQPSNVTAVSGDTSSILATIAFVEPELSKAGPQGSGIAFANWGKGDSQ